MKSTINKFSLRSKIYYQHPSMRLIFIPKILWFSLTFMLILVFSSCNKNEDDNGVPSYIQIDSIQLIANGTGLDGALTSNFSDAWVYLNGNSRGMYELPVKIPLLASGQNRLQIFGGIKKNGIASFRSQYPFLEYYFDDAQINLKRGEITKITPQVKYYENVNFAWIEDFEQTGITIDSVQESYTRFSLTNDPNKVRSGTTSAVIELTKDNFFFKASTSEVYQLPKGGKEIFLELDYKAESEFSVFLTTYNPTGKLDIYSATIRPKINDLGKNVWNKIYVELTGDVSEQYDSKGFTVGVTASLPSDKDQSEILLDNFKLLHQ